MEFPMYPYEETPEEQIRELKSELKAAEAQLAAASQKAASLSEELLEVHAWRAAEDVAHRHDLDVSAEEVRAAKDLATQLSHERDEATASAEALQIDLTARDQEIRELEAERQRWILGTSHGTACWLDESGWHCGPGCKNPDARQCDDGRLLDQARTKIRDLEKEIAQQDDTCQGLALSLVKLREERQRWVLEVFSSGRWHCDPDCHVRDLVPPEQLAIRPWLVVRVRETNPPEVWQFAGTEEAQARTFFADAGAQWSETFLCRVVAGPEMPQGSIPLHPLQAQVVALAEELKQVRNTLFQERRDRKVGGCM